MRDIERGGDARRDVLAARRRRRDEGVVVRHQRGDERCDILRERIAIGGIVGEQHLGDARDLRGGVGDGLRTRPGDEDMHLSPQLPGGGDGGERRVLEDGVVVLGENQAAHAIAPRTFNLSTSSSTFLTLMPADRFDGSTTLRMVSRGVGSTP